MDKNEISLKYLATIGKQIWWILLLGFIIRFILAVSIDTVIFSDCKWYYAAAVSLTSGEGFSTDGRATAYRVPGFPFIASILFRIFGEHPRTVFIYNAFISVLILWLTGAIASLYTRKWKTVVLLLALYPEHILYTNVFATELTFQLSLLLWFAFRYNTIINGILTSISAYIRPVSLLLPPFFAVFNKKVRKKYIIATIIALLLMVPWTIRNLYIIGKPSLSTNLWVNLWIGNSAGAKGEYFTPPTPNTQDEVEREKWFRHKLTKDLRKNPLHPILILPLKAFYFWVPTITPVSWGLRGIVSRTTKIVITVILTLLNLLLLFFLVKSIINKPPPKELLLITTYFWLVSMLFFGADRFRFPILPFLLILAFL
ncbi:hypothetical protein J7K99_07295 [bacterium]|nr:hypothetical protein [bacterium]